jgi:hypothetical protein
MTKYSNSNLKGNFMDVFVFLFFIYIYRGAVDSFGNAIPEK